MVQKFSDLTMQFLRKGAEGSKQMFSAAAKNLKTQPKVVESAVNALCYLFAQATKLNLNAQDFLDSLVVLSLGDEKNEVLRKSFIENKAEIQILLNTMNLDLPHYTDLSWRLDVKLASRNCRNLVNPVFLIKLETTTPESKPEVQILQTDFVNLKHLCSELEAALDTTKQIYARRVVRNINT